MTIFPGPSATRYWAARCAAGWAGQHEQAGMSDAVRFDDRVILTTGAGRGIGRALALLLAERGAHVVVADNGAALDGAATGLAPAESAVREICDAGGSALACTADIATEQGCDAAIAACLESFGRIDGIAHVASTSPDLTTTDRLSTADLDLVMRINAYAGLWLARAAWPHMAAAGYGRILLTTSAGIYGSFGNAHYAAAKAAVLGAMRCLAVEGAPLGIMVNAMAPGARTRMTERIMESAYADWFLQVMDPEKVAPGAAFLLSEECNIHGEAFAIAGGRIARMAIAEATGEQGVGSTIEAARDVFPAIVADTSFFHPKELGERSTVVAGLLGFDGGLDWSGGIAVHAAKET